MADQKITDLTAKTTLHDTDVIPLVDVEAAPDTTKKITGANVKAQVLASSTFTAHKDRHDPEDGADALDTAAPSEIAGVQAAGAGSSHSLARADHAHQIQHGIADNHLVTVDDTDAADNDYAKFTANGLEGRSYAEVLSDLSGDAGATFSWNGQQLSNVCCENGSTFPTSPADAMWFRHQPTGRDILYQYDGATSAWLPIISFGTMTVYVDKTDGTDDLDHGTAVDSDAFATAQYAVDCIPGLVSGNVTIYINAENYDETVTIQGKSPTGNYTITLQGTLTENSSGTQSANGAAGTGATQGSFTDTGNLADIANLLCYLDADGDYRIIDSTDGDTATIVGTFTSQPLQNENYVIYDWGTTINNIVVAVGQKAVYMYNIEFDTAPTALVYAGGELTSYRCYWGEYVQCFGGIFDFYYSYLTSTASHGIFCTQHGIVQFLHSKIYIGANNHYGLYAYSMGYATFVDGSVVDAVSTTGTIGLFVSGTAHIICYSVAGDGYPRIRNCAIGFKASVGGTALYTSNNQYSGNTDDEDPDAASFGYIG